MSAIWVNEKLEEAATAAVSVFDRGFSRGDGLFETMRAYGGRIFRLDGHLDRLSRSARRIGLSLPAGLADAAWETLAASGESEAAVRLTVSRGPGDEGVEPPDVARPTVVVTARPYEAPAEWYEAGIRAMLASGRLNEFAATAGLKKLGCLDSVMAQAEARAMGAQEALLLDTTGHLAEGAISNLFLVADGALHTAPLACGVLPGITRAAVLELADALGVPVHADPILPEMLQDASEVFITSSLRELVPVMDVHGRAVGVRAPGPVTLRLLAAYRELVRSELSVGSEAATATG